MTVNTDRSARRRWTLHRHHPDHCPGGCYWFRAEPEHPDGTFHVPLKMYWGAVPWRWF